MLKSNLAACPVPSIPSPVAVTDHTNKTGDEIGKEAEKGEGSRPGGATKGHICINYTEYY